MGRRLQRNALKKSFTLIEIAIVSVLIALIGTFVGVQGYSLLEEYRFQQTRLSLSREFLLGQQLALSHQSEIVLFLECEGGKLYLSKRSEEPSLRYNATFSKKICLGKAEALLIDHDKQPFFEVLLTDKGQVFPGSSIEVIYKKHHFQLR